MPSAVSVAHGNAATIVVNVPASLVPSDVTNVTMTTATRPAIRPYSNAVTPRSSFASVLRLFRNAYIVVSMLPSRGCARARLRELRVTWCLSILPAD